MVIPVPFLYQLLVTDHACHHMLYLNLEGINHLINAGKSFRVRRSSAYPPAAIETFPAIKGELKANRQIEETGISRKKTFPGQGQLHAPYHRIIACFLQGIAMAGERCDSCLITEESRYSSPFPCHIYHSTQVMFRRTGMNPHLIIGITEARFFHNIEENVGKIIYRIFSLLIHSSHYRRLDYKKTTMILACSF